jgi:hypothetical protein
VKEFFRSMCRDMEVGDWQGAYETAKLLPPLDDVLRLMASNQEVTTANEIADKVFAMPWNAGTMPLRELRSKVRRMCEAAWSIESHAKRIALGREEMLEPPTGPVPR